MLHYDFFSFGSISAVVAGVWCLLSLLSPPNIYFWREQSNADTGLPGPRTGTHVLMRCFGCIATSQEATIDFGDTSCLLLLQHWFCFSRSMLRDQFGLPALLSHTGLKATMDSPTGRSLGRV